MPTPQISKAALERRAHWIAEIVQLSGRFGQDAQRVEAELRDEIKRDGVQALQDHLRLCGTIPERYAHDSSEEKLYSKYTDAVLSVAFKAMGLKSAVLPERADAADVTAVAPTYSLVADAKAFRLSRTAKNQKDFKVEALHGWKHGAPHAMVVCPIYQLPTRTSQIYKQALERDVCIFSYSHLSVLVRLAQVTGPDDSMALLLKTLRCAETLNPTKDALLYWRQINSTMLDLHPDVRRLWGEEKLATSEAVLAAKEEALTALAQEREAILRMSHDDALSALIKNHNIDGRTNVVRAVEDTALMSLT